MSSDETGYGIRRFSCRAALSAAALSIALCSCGQSPKGPAAKRDGTLRVLCSFLPMYVFAANVVGDAPGVEVRVMLPAELGCPHDYALTPGDMRAMAEADLFVAHGMGMEESLGDPVRKANPDLVVVVASEGIEPLKALEKVSWTQGGGGHEGHGHDEANPHAWVSLTHAQAEVRNIAAALSKARPGLKDRFQANAEAYCGRLASLREEFVREVKGFPNARVLTSHDAFAYFARDIGLEIAAVIEEAPGQEPSAGALMKLVEAVRKLKPAAVFSEPGHSDKVARTVGSETGVPVHCLDPVTAGRPEPGYYEEAMRKNLETLKTALGRAK